MRRSHPLSDQLPGEHTGQGLPYLSFPVGTINLFGIECTYSTNCHQLPGTHFTDPPRDGRLSQTASSGVQTCNLSHKSQTRYWLSYLGRLTCLYSLLRLDPPRDCCSVVTCLFSTYRLDPRREYCSTVTVKVSTTTWPYRYTTRPCMSPSSSSIKPTTMNSGWHWEQIYMMTGTSFRFTIILNWTPKKL